MTEKRTLAISLARQVIAKYGADADKPSVHLAKALLDGAGELDQLRKQLANVNASLAHALEEHNRFICAAETGDIVDSLDARRYRRLRVLGAAPGGSPHLDRGHVICFTGLDHFVDVDIVAHPHRGEAVP